ncbi:MAG: hypothetical protein IKG23_05175 [Clostridia bacterium]|nr:hypothetical protein [Clostridia bacterium]
MKKVIALLLVLVMALVVFSSCAKKEEAQEKGNVSYTVVNSTGKKVTEITLSDTRSENKMNSKAGEGGLPDGESVGIELEVVLEKNAPDVMFGFTVEDGDNLVGHVMQKAGTITLKLEDGKPAFDISEPGK